MSAAVGEGAELPGIELAREPYITVWPSRLAELDRCGRAYRNRYVLGLRGEEAPSHPALELGLAVHRELEKRHTAPGRHDEPEPILEHDPQTLEAVARFVAAHRTVCPGGPQGDAAYRGGERTLGWRFTDERVLLLATIDAVWERPDGTIELRDYKTGGLAPDPTEDPAAAVHALLGRLTWPDRPLRVVYERLAHDPVLAAVDVDEEVVAGAARRVRHHAATLRAGDLPARPGPVCEPCPWRSTCPASVATGA
ncbi:PD-(D/E)XK nuclease family protein [Egibacter rhizosphaerae]|uniref:PD-(D/E)XK nuclease family protein n=1 Tax=Egibacter rhizosphaerae TaxID=1670831 RepID=A0A411YG56_9ACTN|nr:PD-(D/E)XK nuclease family protein [Egibacter rhizosphaerae]QBI20193.1 PD-(D/E)XK nuclease family protein [Egibacter rhizosphaerae]